MGTQSLKDKSKLTRFELITLIAAASVTITLVSTCSPLYPFNPWDDANCFFTLGRGILHGLVPYRDLYEQKGPLLYFIYALVALLSEKSFIGAWIIELVTTSVFAIYSWKIIKLFAEPSKYMLVLMPLFLGITYSNGMFNFGGNAEEFCFPLLTVVFYIGLRAIIKGNGLPNNKEALFCGAVTGILFWIKFTFIGFIAGFCLYILVVTIKRKEIKKLFSLIGLFLAAFIVITIPILIYFLATGSLMDLWESYFYNKIFYMNTSEARGIMKVPVIKNIITVVVSLGMVSVEYPHYPVQLLLTLASFFFISKEHRKKTLRFFLVTFVFAAFFAFLSSSVIYYYGYILSYCFGLGLIPVISLLGKLEKKLKKNNDLIKALTLIFFSVGYALTILLCKNMYMFLQPKQYLSQYRIAETIKQTPDAKVLTYDFMDCGFYTASEILPANKYYCYNNIADQFPAIREEQNRLIEEGYYDYVITTYFADFDSDNYELIQEESSKFVDYTSKPMLDYYKLYKRVN